MAGLTQIGSWQKISDLGSGAFGIVSLWKNNQDNDYIAIKKCKFLTNRNLTEKQKKRWHNEVDILKTINHPNIIKYKPLPSDLEDALLKENPTSMPLMPMEYCKRGNLRHLLCKSKNICGLEEFEIRYILEDISSGLQYLHNLNITHRDIKPDNIVLQQCDDRIGNTIYKIIDLGYAKELRDSIVSFVGTLHYLAPEIFETEHYDYSVDYWSLGILTFEIICGVLPYLPHIPPIERFGKIKDKGVDDICIYLNYSGQIANSSEIKREHFISSTFKGYIEIWLRHVMQFDRNKRRQNFSGDIKVLDYLQNILKKSIVKVFSVRKLEFYSYEIDNSTLVGTLKDWISRDIKIAKSDVLLIVGKEATCVKDEQFLQDLLGDETDVYVISKSYLMAETIPYCFPKLVKEVMKSALNFKISYFKQLRSQMVFYISSEKILANYFKKSFFLYLDYVNSLVKQLDGQFILTDKCLSTLLMKVDCYCKIRKRNGCDKYSLDETEYSVSLSNSLRLMTSLERSITNFNDLVKKMRKVVKKNNILRQVLPEITELLNKYNMEDQLSKAVILLEKTAVPNSDVRNISKNMVLHMTKLISETIKVKDSLFKNSTFKAYLRAMKNVLNGADDLLKYMEQYKTHIQELNIAFDQVESVHHSILISAGNNKSAKSSNSSLNEALYDLPSSYLIKENQELRYKIENILAASILEHKEFKDSTKPYSVL